MLKYRKDKEKLFSYIRENKEEIRGLDSVERTAAMVLLGEQKRLLDILNEKDEKKEEPDMCEAITELIEDGRNEGAVCTTAELTLQLLERLGEVPDHVKERLREQKNLDTLKMWFGFAMAAESLEEFERAVGQEGEK